MSQNSKKLVKYIIILCISIIIIYLLLKYQRHFSKISFKRLREYILGYGKFASVIFIILYSLKPIVIFIPVTLFIVLAGSIFDPIQATILSTIGVFCSGTVAFYLARALGKPFVGKILKGKALKLEDNIEEHGFKVMFIMRVSTLFPYDPLSYAAGLTAVKYKDFIIASVLGIFPEIIAYSILGKNLKHPLSFKFFLPIILIVLIALSGSYLYKVKFKGEKK